MAALKLAISSFIVHSFLVVGGTVLAISPFPFWSELLVPLTFIAVLFIVGAIAFLTFTNRPHWRVFPFELGVASASVALATFIALLDWMGATEQDLTLSTSRDFAHELVVLYATSLRSLVLVLFLALALVGVSSFGALIARRRNQSHVNMPQPN